VIHRCCPLFLTCIKHLSYLSACSWLSSFILVVSCLRHPLPLLLTSWFGFPELTTHGRCDLTTSTRTFTIFHTLHVVPVTRILDRLPVYLGHRPILAWVLWYSGLVLSWNTVADGVECYVHRIKTCDIHHKNDSMCDMFSVKRVGHEQYCIAINCPTARCWNLQMYARRGRNGNRSGKRAPMRDRQSMQCREEASSTAVSMTNNDHGRELKKNCNIVFYSKSLAQSPLDDLTSHILVRDWTNSSPLVEKL